MNPKRIINAVDTSLFAPHATVPQV
jgi:hypothetical protein